MRRLKKAYIEITNKCNLSCSFCAKTSRKKQEMSVEDFSRVIKKVKPHTDYVYLHVLGEPLTHSGIGSIMDICGEHHIKVNITTNGVLIKEAAAKILKPALRQVNFSMHTEEEKHYGDIAEFIKQRDHSVFINLRYWNNTGKSSFTRKLGGNVFESRDSAFTWPALDGAEIFTGGKCYALKDHIAVLADGTVVPCCIDANGDMPLGNIFGQSLEDIMNSPRAAAIRSNFENRLVAEKLCRRCGFAQRLNHNAATPVNILLNH